MSSASYQWAVQVGAPLGTVAAVAAVAVSVRAWKRQRNPIDLAFAVATASWLVYLLASSVNALAVSNPWAVFVAHVSYQIALISVAFFILVSASITRFSVHSVWMAQGVLGLLLLLTWNVWSTSPQDFAYRLWVIVNLAFASALSVYVGFNAYSRGSYRCWLALVGSLLGLGICFEDMLGAERLRSGNTLAQYFYATFLLLFWLLTSNRAGRPELAFAPETDDPPVTTWDAVTGFGLANKLATEAVADERQRIAQDLHDGVGSQLVNILATLDTHAPQQQAVALALEQCLIDLKMMVDGIDDTNQSLINALGSLRYRVQHSLDKLGIRMIWNVDMDGPLQDFRGDRAQQVLRISQECLSNIMRHAKASVIEFICLYVSESDSLLLEVRDNGRGIPSREAGRPLGKGLESMRLRARKLGGQLQIFTKEKVGTRMRLLVPLHVRQFRKIV